MKKVRVAAIAVSTFACAAIFSFDWSEQGGISMSVESAQARVGRPLTPVSAAGVARRQTRRGVYGAGVAGAAVVGTAAAVAAAPYYGSGYYTGGPYYGRAGYAGGPYYGRAGYAGGPYYQGTAYSTGGPSPVGWPGGVSSSDRDQYIRNLRDSGYDTKKNFNPSGNLVTQ
jgi:hypothetical protein